jgi:hypothetical protein
VVNFRNEVLGIVTRIDLVSANYYQESSSEKRRSSRQQKIVRNWSPNGSSHDL